MNKNLSKLAKKAGFVTWSDESWGPGKGHIDWANEYDEELEKFAKLLIQKCVDQCRQEWYDTNNDPKLNAETDPRLVGIKIGVKQGALKCIARINKHFDIE